MEEKLPLLWNEKKSKRNWGVKLLLGVFVTWVFFRKEIKNWRYLGEKRGE